MNRRDFIKTTAATGGGTLIPQASTAGQGPTVPSAPSPLPRTVVVPTLGPQLPDLAPAEWIWYPSGRCLANTFVLFRYGLLLKAKPVRTRGWIAADSRYRLEINGERIQWGPAPSDPRWAEADPLDLTERLQAGRNAIGATVLYYGHGDGTWPFGKPGFLFWLEIEYADGTKEKAVSNAGWQAQLCRAWKPGQYKRWFLRSLQEEFDARLYPYGWSTPDFVADNDWLPSMPLGGSPNKPAILTKYVEYASGVRSGPEESQLRPRSIPLLRETVVPATRFAESLGIKWSRPPVEYFECRPPNAFAVERRPTVAAEADGSWRLKCEPGLAAALTFEFAEQIVGWPRFTITATAGTVVELLVQESHQVGGPALLDTGRDSWTRFVCREGVNHFECFDYESLRWLQLHLREVTGVVVVRDVGVRRRMYPWPHEPTIRTSEPRLQRLFEASINTLHNCAQDVMVDGMGRERQQYSGDCAHQLRAVRQAFGETRLPARFLATYSQGLTTEGYFLDCWPAYDRLARMTQRQLGLFHLGPILDHGVQFVFDCWHHYADTGDLDAVREPYPRLLRFVDYLRSLVGVDGLLPVEDLGIPCVWMDYQAYRQSSGVAPPFTQRHKQCAFNLYTAAMMRHALAPLCRALGDPARAVVAAELGAALEGVAVKRFWSRAQGLFVNNLPWLGEELARTLCDRSLATAVLFDQCPGGDTSAAVKALADCPPEMGLSYPANAGWRLWALAKGGRADVIIKDLRERWATMDSVLLNNTVQEGWKARPDSPSQWSHCAVAPLYIAHQSLAGIRPLSPGYKRVEVRPQLADLPDLHLMAHTPLGPIQFDAEAEKKGHRVRLTIPAGMEAELLVTAEAAPMVKLPLVASDNPKGLKRFALISGGDSDFFLK